MTKYKASGQRSKHENRQTQTDRQQFYGQVHPQTMNEINQELSKFQILSWKVYFTKKKCI